MTSGEHTKGHTELPWRVDSSPPSNCIRGQSGVIVAVKHREAIDVHNANCDLIVTAVNTYPAVAELVKALELMVKYADWTVGPESPSHHPTLPSAIGVARSALTHFRGLESRVQSREAQAGGWSMTSAPTNEMLARLDASQKACFDAGQHIAAMDIQDARAYIVRLSATTSVRDVREANRIWFDTEFIEDGSTIDLISIGLVRADGATYYAETDQWIPGKASQWVKDNVIVHLRGGEAIKPRDVIAREIVEFVGEDPEFWAYYADYDWVALCQLYGTMMQLPDGWPMFCRDLKQLCVDVGNPELPKQLTTEHHALADAEWTKTAWKFCASLSNLGAAAPAAGGDAVERIAQWLHDETNHPESYPNHTWPETERDDGQREGGFLKIVPLHGQEYFRDIARRLVRQFMPANSIPPLQAPEHSDAVQLPPMPSTADRGWFDEKKDYLESDQDWARNNADAVEWLADNHSAIRAALTAQAAKPPAVSGADVGRIKAAIAPCKGEQYKFEDWAKSQRYDMTEHPLHYIFMDTKTKAARMGWKAALEYVERTIQSAAQGGGTESDGGVEGHAPKRREPENADVRERAGIKPGPSDPPSQEASAPKGGGA